MFSGKSNRETSQKAERERKSQSFANAIGFSLLYSERCPCFADCAVLPSFLETRPVAENIFFVKNVRIFSRVALRIVHFHAII